MLQFVQNWITKLRWVIGISVPVLIGVNEIWEFVDIHRLNQIIATLATLGLLSKGQSTDEVGASDKEINKGK